MREIGSSSGPGTRAAFTLIELMVVIAIIGILTAAMIPEMKGSFEDTLLRSTSRDLINVFDLANSRAVSLNEIRRVKLDTATGRYLVERQTTDQGIANFVPADDVPGDHGQLDSRIKLELRKFDEMLGDEDSAAPLSAPASAEDNTISFYPDGTADRSEVRLQDRQGFQLVLQVNPVTARVHAGEPQAEDQP